MSGTGGSGCGRSAQRRLAVVAVLALAGIFAVVASAASAKHTKPLKLNVDGWELSARFLQVHPQVKRS
jgi:hypothetical protein